MPMFQWQAPPLPNEGTITDLLLRGPDAIARAAEMAGQARATAQANSANIWGRAVDNVGQTVAEIPQQIQAQKSAAIRTEAEQMQLDAMRRDAKSRFMLESALKNPDNRTADGNIDTEKVTNFLRDNDIGAWQTWQSISQASQKNAVDLAEKVATINKTNADIAEKQRQFKEAQGNYLGRMAFTAINTLNEKPGDPLHARDVTLSAVARAAADGAISEPDAKQFLIQTATAMPDQLAQVFSSFVSPELRGKLEKEAADTAKAKAEADKAAAEAADIRNTGRTPPAQAPGFRNPATKNAVIFVNGKYKDSVTGEIVPQPEKEPPPRDTLAEAIARATLATHQQDLNDKQRKASVGQSIFEGIKAGTIPPDSAGLQRQGVWADVLDAAAKEGFNLTNEELKWKSAVRQVNTLNGQQQMKLRQSIGTLLGPNGNDGSLDAVADLAKQWDSAGLGPLSRANLELAKQGAKGPVQQSLATRLDHQITEAAFEYAVVTQGGGVPTDQARSMAANIVQDWWAKSALLDNIAQAKRNIGYRQQAIENAAPITGAVPGMPPPQAKTTPTTAPGGVTVVSITPVK